MHFVNSSVKVLTRTCQWMAVGVAICIVFLLPSIADAATISVSPSTGVYTTGNTFTVRVQLDTAGKPVNAADGTLTFNPKELSVVSVSKGSVFSLWTAEPSFSNSGGTVSFSGGSPSGYTGSGATIISVTFRTLTSGTARVSLSGGSVLAADGRGTNVLTGMSGGTYTLSAATTQPEAEVIVEYVPPANTPGTPVVTSSSHPDTQKWYTKTTAELSWTVPAGVEAVRTLLDRSPSSVPTKVYDTPISSLSISDLEEGVSYFHVQFRNADGWGKVAHYRLAVDTKKPENVVVAIPENTDTTNPAQSLQVTIPNDAGASNVVLYKVQINGQEVKEYTELTDGKLPLPALEPGYHTLTVEVLDAAGNSHLTTLSVTVAAFEKPAFVSPAAELLAGTVPVFKGTTRPGASVEVYLTEGTAEPRVYTVAADNTGSFNFIPDTAMRTGVYSLRAQATDVHGAKSEMSDTVRFVVQEPGYIVIGSMLVNVLSTFITVVALAGVLLVGVWFLLFKWRRLRSQVRTESEEAAAMLHREFSVIKSVLLSHRESLANSRKTKKLTKAEDELMIAVESALVDAELRVGKEVSDVQHLVSKNK